MIMQNKARYRYQYLFWITSSFKNSNCTVNFNFEHSLLVTGGLCKNNTEFYKRTTVGPVETT